MLHWHEICNAANYFIITCILMVVVEKWRCSQQFARISGMRKKMKNFANVVAHSKYGNSYTESPLESGHPIIGLLIFGESFTTIHSLTRGYSVLLSIRYDMNMTFTVDEGTANCDRFELFCLFHPVFSVFCFDIYFLESNRLMNLTRF